MTENLKAPLPDNDEPNIDFTPSPPLGTAQTLAATNRDYLSKLSLGARPPHMTVRGYSSLGVGEPKYAKPIPRYFSREPVYRHFPKRELAPRPLPFENLVGYNQLPNGLIANGYTLATLLGAYTTNNVTKVDLSFSMLNHVNNYGCAPWGWPSLEERTLPGQGRGTLPPHGIHPPVFHRHMNALNWPYVYALDTRHYPYDELPWTGGKPGHQDRSSYTVRAHQDLKTKGPVAFVPVYPGPLTRLDPNNDNPRVQRSLRVMNACFKLIAQQRPAGQSLTVLARHPWRFRMPTGTIHRDPEIETLIRSTIDFRGPHLADIHLYALCLCASPGFIAMSEHVNKTMYEMITAELRMVLDGDHPAILLSELRPHYLPTSIMYGRKMLAAPASIPGKPARAHRGSFEWFPIKRPSPAFVAEPEHCATIPFIGDGSLVPRMITEFEPMRQCLSLPTMQHALRMGLVNCFAHTAHHVHTEIARRKEYLEAPQNVQYHIDLQEEFRRLQSYNKKQRGDDII